MKCFKYFLYFSIISVNFCQISEVTPEEENIKPEKEEKFWPKPEPEFGPTSGPSNDECVRRIYRDCNYPTVFTDEELENVRQFLNYSFTQLADIKPEKPLCPKLHVRQDWKCLSPQQRTRIVNVWKKLYDENIIQGMTNLHVKTWPEWHKSHEFLSSHRWFTNQFEKAMRSVDPRTALPYWDPYAYGIQPERSSVWDTLGHSGNYSNGYVVTDGVYGEWELIPQLKRQWSPRNTIYPWFTSEFITSAIQTATSYPELVLYVIGAHFPPHLNVGGYDGQYSVREAPYDLLFYMHHLANTDVALLKWQFMNRKHLTPLSYNLSYKYRQSDAVIEQANILTDTLTGVPWVTIRETFWMGFGDYCGIPDQFIKPISNLWKGIIDNTVPTAAKRLPPWILAKYFPHFYSGNFTSLSHILEEVGECNTVCLPIPKPTFMKETENGRRQFEAYRYDNGIDETAAVELAEQQYYQMWLDFNRAEYCSPYVTTY